MVLRANGPGEFTWPVVLPWDGRFLAKSLEGFACSHSSKKILTRWSALG